MRPTDIARVFFTSLLLIKIVSVGFCQDASTAALFKSVACTDKNDLALEKRFCADVVAQARRYRPLHVAPNRTLPQTIVEFAVWAEGDRITLSSVLVKDPIGKNTIKLVFSPPAAVSASGTETMRALEKILEIRAPTKSVGWIVTAPISTLK
jgi:hypothetical protein